jgi:ribosome-associated protein
MVRISNTLSIDDAALTETFVRASGPGGQNVNKVASAVQLRLDLSASGLPPDVRARLERIAGKRLTQAGEIVVTSQRHRSQDRNRAAAMETLLRLVRQAEATPTKRVPTRPTAASRLRHQQSKTRRARLKESRRTPSEDA